MESMITTINTAVCLLKKCLFQKIVLFVTLDALSLTNAHLAFDYFVNKKLIHDKWSKEFVQAAMVEVIKDPEWLVTKRAQGKQEGKDRPPTKNTSVGLHVTCDTKNLQRT